MNIKKGTTRIVFVFSKVVVKIPNFSYSWQHFIKGILGNIQERDTWLFNSGDYERGKSYLLCPVLWCSWGGWILVMKRAMPCKFFFVSTLIDEHKKHFPGDDNQSNYGFLDNRIVKIDYGGLNTKL